VWAALASLEGRLAEAARLIGFVDAERARTARRPETIEERIYGELSPRLEKGLRAAELASLKKEGASWTKPEAIEFVRSQLLSRDPARTTDLSEPGERSRRKGDEPILPR
jgi:hypothetical protein